MLLMASPLLIMGGLVWLEEKYEAGQADWAEGISEANEAIGAVSGAFVDSMMGTPSKPCTADHCDSENNAINAEDSSLFWAPELFFLKGRINNFYSRDVDGFQDGWSLYRFDADADLINELEQKAGWKQGDHCNPQSFQRHGNDDWWQPELISDAVCYRGYFRAVSYQVLHSPERQATYIYHYTP